MSWFNHFQCGATISVDPKQVDNWNGKGSILAPGALVNFTSGEIDGSIYARESFIAGTVNLAVPVTPKCPMCPYPPPCTW